MNWELDELKFRSSSSCDSAPATTIRDQGGGLSVQINRHGKIRLAPLGFGWVAGRWGDRPSPHPASRQGILSPRSPATSTLVAHTDYQQSRREPEEYL